MSLAAPLFTNHPICDSIRNSAGANCVASSEKGDFRESRVGSVGCSTRQRNLRTRLDPEKWMPVFRKACPRAGPEGSCSIKNLERDLDSIENDRAPGENPD